MGVVDVTVALGVVKVAGKVTAAEIGKPDEALEDAATILSVDEGVPMLVNGVREGVVDNESLDVVDKYNSSGRSRA